MRMPAATLREVYTAVKLRLDAALTPPVYDEVPAEASYPFVTLNVSFDLLSPSTGRVMISAKVWSTYAGSMEALTTMETIISALDQVRLTVNERLAVIPQWEGNSTSLVGDGYTRLGEVVFAAAVHS